MPTDVGRLNALIDRAEPRLRRAFLQAVLQMKEEATLPQLAELIAAGRTEEALATLEAAVGRFANSTNAVLINAGESTATFIGGALGTIIDFDQVNERAVANMRANRFRLVTQFTQEQVVATREALTEGIIRGLNPRQQARAFRASLGLTESQVGAVNNFRRLLEENSSETLTRQLRDRRFDSTIRRAVDSGDPLSRAQVDRMVTRYEQRSLVMRSETIARTESLRAVHEGNDEMFRQAFESGDLKPEQLTQFWNIAGDIHVRDSHTSMDGQERAVGVPFETGAGNLLRFPGDSAAPAEEVVQCRCALSNRITT